MTESNIDLQERWWIEKSRKNFLAYRMYIRAGQFKHNWFIHSLTAALQKFYVDYKAGKRPILIISCPPQHGKTWAIEDLISWMAGQDPDCRMVYASFSEYLGKRCNSANQRVFDSEKYKKIFPKTWVSPKDCDEDVKGTYVKNSNLVEFINRQGSLRNTTVGGPITGESLDCVSWDTEIITDKGPILIKDLTLPARVLSFDLDAWTPEFQDVTNFKKVTKTGGVRVDGLGCTGNHEIYSLGTGYQAAEDFQIDRDILLTLKGPKRVSSIEKIDEEMDFYDITVKNNHNFFANDILVHNCGFVDDAFKGRQEANSPVTRETVWNWFTDDFGTRFSDPAGYIITMTRWHVDDIVGRLLAKLDDPDRVTVFKYAAIAEEDEQFRKKGEALFPELKSLEFLLGKKAIMLEQAWQSLYQGSPIAVGGNLIDERWWQWWERLPLMKFTYAVADTAQKTNNWNDYTVFQLWGMGVDGNIYLLDMFYDRVKAPDLRRQAEIFYRSADNSKYGGPFRGFLIEDKSSGTGLIQELEEKNFKVIPIPRVTDKVTRAFDTGPEIRAGKVFLNAAIPHVNVIITESGIFPNGANDDAFDCSMNGIEVAYIYPELLNNTIFVG